MLVYLWGNENIHIELLPQSFNIFTDGLYYPTVTYILPEWGPYIIERTNDDCNKVRNT